MSVQRFFATWRRRSSVFNVGVRRRKQLATIPTAAEVLEERTLLAAAFPSIDGKGNNVAHPDWGSAGADLLRTAPAAYSDGTSSPAGTNRPSARAISNAIGNQGDAPTNDRDMSAFVYAWGQFIDHDLDLTTSASPAVAFNVAVPKGDPYFDPNSTGTQTIPLSRSKYDAATGTSATNPRQQVTDITAWIDGSMVYGSDTTTAASLRTMSGGKLKTSATGNLLPSSTTGPNAQFNAGDIRANENVELISVQTLLMREHNRIADQIAKSNPSLSDEALYQQARLKVIAEIHAITYNEFLPALLGPNAVRPYQGYNPNVNPGIANEFSAAAFRVGHTMVGDDVEFLDNNGNPVRDELPLAQAFFNPDIVRQTGIDPILKYLASDEAQEVDTHIVDGLRNFLFGPPGSGGMDLAALNIQRGRDHGLADYNTTRAAYGLPKVRDFSEITPDPVLQKQLKDLYGNVNNIDLWVGGLAEKHLPGSSVGPTFSRIIASQFERLRDGDRFWYQRMFTGRELDDLQHTRLSDLIKRNTTLTNLQDNVFIFETVVTGRVFGDGNRDGIFNPQEMGLGGRVIQLVNADGNVVATTKTRPDGTYVFEGLDLGTYTVREVVPAGAVLTTKPPQPIAITRGMVVKDVNFGEAPSGTTTTPPTNTPPTKLPPPLPPTPPQLPTMTTPDKPKK